MTAANAENFCGLSCHAPSGHTALPSRHHIAQFGVSLPLPWGSINFPAAHCEPGEGPRMVPSTPSRMAWTLQHAPASSWLMAGQSPHARRRFPHSRIALRTQIIRADTVARQTMAQHHLTGCWPRRPTQESPHPQHAWRLCRRPAIGTQRGPAPAPAQPCSRLRGGSASSFCGSSPASIQPELAPVQEGARFSTPDFAVHLYGVGKYRFRDSALLY